MPLADLSNTIIHLESWDHEYLHDRISDNLDIPLSLTDSTPFHMAKELAVTILPDDLGKDDIYIDNSIGITPDLHDNTKRVSRAIPLVIHTLSRPLSSSDVIHRKDIISMKKYAAEGRMEEQKTVLGWIINTRTLRISLPPHKHMKWSKEIHRLFSIPKVKAKHLEAILGSLNNVACIYNPMRHFLGRIYQALYRANSFKGWTALKNYEKEDFKILLCFLDSTSRGISMNHLTFRKPTHIYRLDSSEFGLGGYNTTSGVGWRFELPVDCRRCMSIN